jgi:hypothetical protein
MRRFVMAGLILGVMCSWGSNRPECRGCVYYVGYGWVCP